MMNVEQSVEWRLAGETEVPGENVPQLHFVHHKSHMTGPGLEPGKPATNRLRYGTAKNKNNESLWWMKVVEEFQDCYCLLERDAV
jgi:hypothetical protein